MKNKNLVIILVVVLVIIAIILIAKYNTLNGLTSSEQAAWDKVESSGKTYDPSKFNSGDLKTNISNWLKNDVGLNDNEIINFLKAWNKKIKAIQFN